MKRAWKWTKRIVLGTLAFVVLALAITLGTLHTSWGRNRLRLIVEDQLEAQFPGSTIGRVDGSVLGDLILRDIVILGRDKRPFITVKKVTLEAALLPFASKTAHIKSITVEDVVVYVHDQGPKPVDKPKPPSGPSEASTWSVELPVIDVLGGRIEIENPSGKETIDKLDAHVSLTLRAGEPMVASVLASAAWRQRPITLTAAAQSGSELEVMYAIATLGDARAIALGTHVDGTKLAGVVAAQVPAALAKQLGDVELPGDASVVAKLTRTGGVELDAKVGAATARVLAHADLETLTTHAILAAELPELAAISQGRANGHGTVAATVIASPDRVDGIVAIVGDAQGYAGSAVIGTQATLEKATVVAAGTGVGWTFGASADLAAANQAWTLTRSEVAARAYNLDPMRGELTAAITATGPLTPVASLDVKGTVDGRAIRHDDLAIARTHASFAATNVPAAPTGTVQVDTSGVQRGTLKIPSASLGSRFAMDAAGVIDIDLGRHRVVTADKLTWTGTGGHVRITDTSIAATQLVTTSGPAKLTAQATIGRTTDALTVKASAREVGVAMLDPRLKQGTLGADIDVARDGGLWKGSATVDAKQILVPGRPVMDGRIAIKIDKRRVTATATASNPVIGSATVDLDVIGPRDVSDVVAWQRLERSAIQRVRVALANIDASKLGGSGKLDGELAVGALDAGGKVDVKGVVTDVGTLDSQLALAPGPRGEIAAHGTLQLGGVDPVDVDAVIVLPLHPFDPAGWQRLGRETLRSATVEAKRIAFDPALMKRFGVEDSPWRGWVATKIEIGEGARSSKFVLDIHELRDGPLTKPVDIHMTGSSDAKGPHVDATITSDKVTFALSAESPLSVEAMIAGNARTAPIKGTLTVPKLGAKDIAELIGRDDVLAGTVSGTVEIYGTIDEPFGRAQLAVENLSVVGGIASKPPTLEKMELDARWNGMKQGFELELTGHESGGRLLKVSARGQPDAPQTIVATIEASSFDITPFVAFAPPGHPAIGSRGLVSGVLKLKGLDPNTGTVKGRLVVSNARMPLSPELGTFRSGTFEIDVVKDKVVTTIDGKIGRGTVKGKLTLLLTGSVPTTADLTLALRKISPIGEIQPIIDADVTGKLFRRPSRWVGTIQVKNGNVVVPPEGGNELITAGTPGDIVFIDGQKLLIKPKRKPPSAPWLVATVDIGRTKILVDDINFRFDGMASGQLELRVGDGLGLDGAISTERGHVDVLGRQYRLDHGVVDFDGTLDPRLDIEMTHNFRAMTLTVDILGRSSNPDLRLSSDAGGYSQSQLLAFLAGATPSDDPGAASGDAVASGGLAMLSSRLGRKLNKRLPLLKNATINYEAKTATTSRGVRYNKRLGEHTYLNVRQRFEARPDENPTEATIEHELRDNLIFETTAGTRGGGADLLWRKRW